MTTDRFGNQLDPSVGYARGRLLGSSADEVRRLRRAGEIAGEFVSRNGMERIGIFTGNLRYYPVRPEELQELCEEWVGPGLYSEDLRQAAISHLGGLGHEQAAVVNRTSAGIVAAILALSDGRPVVSLVPDGDRSHASVGRGARLAGVPVIEVYELPELKKVLEARLPALTIITTVTSELAVLPDSLTLQAVRLAKAAKSRVLLDEAYGARFRPVLHEGAPSLSFGADLVITNTDKAGLSGPRSGVLCGEADTLVAVAAKASELGMEARAPVAVGAMRSLQAFTPDLLLEEVEDGRRLAEALEAVFGEGAVKRSPLGPKISEEDAHAHVLKIAGVGQSVRVPAEVTAAIGMLLLRRLGVVTVNTHGQPGGRVSLRLKPTAGALKRIGGATALAENLKAAMLETAEHLDDADWFSELLFGTE